MQWFKQNLTLVMSGVVALVLLGGAGLYLYSRVAAQMEIAGQVEERKQKRQTLLEAEVFPSKENIELVKQEQQRLQALLQTAESHFQPVPVPELASVGQFKVLLENTIDQLLKQAKTSGVTLPTNCSFSFTVQRPLMQFDPASLTPLNAQLADVRALTQMLFEARIYELMGVRRSPVSANDSNQGLSQYPGDYLGSKNITTNKVALLYPYEFTFRCTSAELAAILDQVAQAPYGFIVRNVRVEPADAPVTEVETPVMVGLASRYGLRDPGMAARYGLRMPPPPPVAPQAPATPSARKPGPVLKEKALRVSILIELVRPMDKARNKPAK
jgi:hypothetical protein